MRYYMEFKLLDKTTLCVVVDDVRSEKEAKKTAIDISKVCFIRPQDRAFQLTEEMPCKIEKWKEEGTMKYESGNGNRYEAIIFYNMALKLPAKYDQIKGPKTVYKQILGKSKKKPRVVFIYDVNQKPQKKRASFQANKIIKDEKKTKEVLLKFEKELKKIPIGGEYLADIPLLLSMIMDYVKGNYKEVPVKAIIGTLGTIIYLISPIDVIPDVIPVIGQLDDVTVVIWLLKQCHKEIQTYKAWKQKQK